MQNRGGMGGGMQIMMRDGPPGAPGADPAELRSAAPRMFKAEMQRWMFALLGTPAGEVTYAGVAESPDGKADMIEMKDARGAGAAPLRRPGHAPAADADAIRRSGRAS